MKDNYNAPQIYLDAAATAKPSNDVLSVVNDSQLHYWGNSSSLHHEGIRALKHLERCRISISKALGSLPEHVVFTSGATESIDLALRLSITNLTPARIVISSVEHPAGRQAALNLEQLGWEIVEWPVDDLGCIDLSYSEELLSEPTKIVSIIWGQSEIGTLQPVFDIARQCRNRGIKFHTDATQILPHGLINWEKLDFDFLSGSAHKLQGPKGVGFLLIRHKCVLPTPSNSHTVEYGLRAGTVPVPLVSGLSKSIDLVKESTDVINSNNIKGNLDVFRKTILLRQKLKEIVGVNFTGHPTIRLPNHISMLVSDKNDNPINSRVLVYNLSKLGLYASSGTACSSGNNQSSLVLRAMNIEDRYLRSGLRFSLGPWTTDTEIDLIPSILSRAIHESLDSQR
ncbi:cysteine desulfurase family protein [Prochlorococcus sp. MIT 1341]|uniref:cysteine desulfurase family protein n=1 Tax=Prochlorococcus sp. MIT 1341 TaxID=3096221 RepID=UPI002A74EBDE|nr:aminotransferase class V-fold PLP-dependent enzyme [Prochlorococcus sp. MIT 1341]